MKQPLPLLAGEPAVFSGSPLANDVSRRGFIGATAATLLAALLVPACGDGTVGVNQKVTPPPDGSVSFVNGVLALKLGLLPELTAANGHQVLALSDNNRRADIVVINLGGTYRAFSSICTHEGCTVTGYSNQRMICPCHGSEFDVSGRPVAGPAPTALREYQVSLDTANQVLTIPV